MKTSIISLVYLVLSCIVLCAEEEKVPEKAPINRVIAIQPFEGIPAAHVLETQKALKTYYQCEVRILPVMKLPKEAFTKVKSPRYRADILLKILSAKLPEGCNHVLGLTASDISATKYGEDGNVKKPEWKYKDWGVFGLGQMSGKSCIVSTHRLKPGVTNAKFLERLRKITSHEIGHNLGLPHCHHSEKCFMRDAVESIATVDAESETLCPHCAKLVSKPVK